jgi:hypothetical protein
MSGSGRKPSFSSSSYTRRFGSPRRAETVRLNIRLGPNTRLSRTSPRASRTQPSSSHRSSRETFEAGVCEILPCRPRRSSSRSSGGPTILKAAGDEQPAAERAQPALALRLVEGRRAAGLGEPGERKAPVFCATEIHAPVGLHFEREAAARTEPQRPYPARRSLIEDQGRDARDLFEPSHPPAQFPLREAVAKEMCLAFPGHSSLLPPGEGRRPGLPSGVEYPCRGAGAQRGGVWTRTRSS